MVGESMVREPTMNDDEATLAVQVRAEADVLLGRLLKERARSEARCRQTGRNDPIKALTGTSALDRAIATTGRMLEHLDVLLGEIESCDQRAALVETAGTAPILEVTRAS